MNRPLAGALILLAVAAAYLVMWWAWRRRAASQAALPPLPSPVAGPLLFGPAEVTYAGTTWAGDWMTRVVAQTLGRRGRATLSVRRGGLAVDRAPETDLNIPAAQVKAARTDRAGAGKATRRPELLIVTWTHGEFILDSAFRPRHRGDLEPMRDAVGALIAEGATP